LIFTRVAACVRASIALEARLAAGLAPTRSGPSPTLRNDPRRADLHDIFRRVTKHHPDHTALLRETTARVDHDLEADPDRTLDLPHLFFTICEDLGIEVDLARLPDRFLGVIENTPAPYDPATNPFDPRATSPP